MKTTLILLGVVFLSGCVESRPIPCVKPAIQIADMSDGMQYGHCVGLDYE